MPCRMKDLGDLGVEACLNAKESRHSLLQSVPKLKLQSEAQGPQKGYLRPITDSANLFLGRERYFTNS
jgi:hypothetical protein